METKEPKWTPNTCHQVHWIVIILLRKLVEIGIVSLEVNAVVLVINDSLLDLKILSITPDMFINAHSWKIPYWKETGILCCLLFHDIPSEISLHKFTKKYINFGYFPSEKIYHNFLCLWSINLSISTKLTVAIHCLRANKP